MLLGLLDIYLYCYGAGTIYRVSVEGSSYAATPRLNFFCVIGLQSIVQSEDERRLAVIFRTIPQYRFSTGHRRGDTG